jgi:hypothetical protein
MFPAGSAGQPTEASHSSSHLIFSRQPILSPHIAPERSLFIDLTFENMLGISLSGGNSNLLSGANSSTQLSEAKCTSENVKVDLFHEHALKLRAITPLIGKRWIFWRMKDVLKCWFCEEVCIAGEGVSPITGGDRGETHSAGMDLP